MQMSFLVLHSHYKLLEAGALFRVVQNSYLEFWNVGKCSPFFLFTTSGFVENENSYSFAFVYSGFLELPFLFLFLIRAELQSSLGPGQWASANWLFCSLQKCIVQSYVYSCYYPAYYGGGGSTLIILMVNMNSLIGCRGVEDRNKVTPLCDPFFSPPQIVYAARISQMMRPLCHWNNSIYLC